MLHLSSLQVENSLCLVLDGKVLLGSGLDVTKGLEKARRRSAGGEASLELGLVASSNLEDSAKLLVEEGIEDLVVGLDNVIEGNLSCASTGEHHFSDSGQ